MTTRPGPILTIDLAGGAAAASIIALAAIFGVAPSARITADQDARNAALNTLRTDTSAVLSDINRLRAATRQIREIVEDKQLVLLARTDLNERIAVLIERTERHGLAVLSIKPGEATEGDLHGRTPIDIALEGPLPGVVRYLHAMRSETADLIVRRLEIRPSAAGVHADIAADWLTRTD